MKRALLCAATTVAVSAAVTSAQADVFQPAPDSTLMPQLPNAAETTVVLSRGFKADADSLTGLFQNFNGGMDYWLDPVGDASATPGSFPGQCGFKVQIVLRASACQNAFGWYNATDPATKPSVIYPIVPASLTAAPPDGIGCVDNDFCPLAAWTAAEPAQHSWANPLPIFEADIRSSPNWTGGPIGFALMGASGGQCSETKYSQADLNDKSSTGAPWITALVYHSRYDTGAYYLAFQDLPMCTASWRGCSPGSNQALPVGQGNDGDFNDYVVRVTGRDCSLAGGAPDGGADASSSSSGAAGAAGAAAGGASGDAGAGVAGAAGVGGAAGTTGAGGVSSGAAGAGGANTGAAGAGGATGASGASGAGAANGSVGGATGTAGDAGTAGAAGGAGAQGAAGTTGGGAGIGGMNSFAGASGSAGRTGTTGAAGNAPFGTTGVDGTGCGCDLAGPASSWSLGTLLLGGLVIARRRRRRQLPSAQE
jgi:MYXO-CTERM domain-containing protein